ncbi:MAG: hydantoinase B/oxoprolinase family protein [Candidatus Schekmanbacteria bacterium]|nr:hydantoinase B/oxoprolinase family protein [Candidatus Schekmanbacteria bacterium]
MSATTSSAESPPLAASPLPRGADAVALEVFRLLLSSCAEEMGAVLMRSALSPNIKERRDFSCAVFSGTGILLAQAEHLPVHLGAMPFSVQAALRQFPLARGDVAVVNDPYFGGSHLPDITMISPVFLDDAADRPSLLVASRAHHADVGGMSPGSMPLSREIFQEGVRIPPVKLITGGRVSDDLWRLILANVRTPEERDGDLRAQLGANRRGVERVRELCDAHGAAQVLAWGEQLLAYTALRVRTHLAQYDGMQAAFTDFLDSDGCGARDLPISVSLRFAAGRLHVDFAGSAPATGGCVNAPRAVTVSAVAYLVRCLVPADVPANAGLLDPVTIDIPPGSVLDPAPPHAVAGGNVETSQRVVDALFGAMAQLDAHIPAASSGTMSNLTLGGVDPRKGTSFVYYETIAGGLGASQAGPGASATHAHMTNTLNTPVEALEHAYPLRVRQYRVRAGSGGDGRHRGGDGLIREIEVMSQVEATVLAERHLRSPWGLRGGGPGLGGKVWVRRRGASDPQPLAEKCSIILDPGDTIGIETPGGGGWGCGTAPVVENIVSRP